MPSGPAAAGPGCRASRSHWTRWLWPGSPPIREPDATCSSSGSPSSSAVFYSPSSDGDGRAPIGEATIVASIFADVQFWNNLDLKDYQLNKEIFLENILLAINSYFHITTNSWLHKELATPRSFAKWTGRPLGMVGGLGQHPNYFGPFGLSSRTPIPGLWLCGDSIYPGEGTAGVSQSAFMVCRQLMEKRGQVLRLSL